jgi:phosphopantothenoylcysteine synthetase/decarboxylase
MEEIEIASWLTLDAIKKKADIVETVGNLQTGHSMSVFCFIEDDYLELCYSDSTANTMRRYEDREEFDLALEERKEETGEAPYEEEELDDDDDSEDEEEEEFKMEDESDSY